MTTRALDWLFQALSQLEAAGLRRTRRTRTSPQGGEVEVEGEWLVNFASNDYLALANDPAVIGAVREVLARQGWGSGASPLVSGTTSEHERLERELAEFEGQESVLLFPTGFAANMATVAAMGGEGDAIYSDAANHASLIDGSRLSKATRHIYRHGDAEDLERQLARGASFRRRLVVTESLFSMDGDLAPLVAIGEVAQKFNAMLMVDEAHATGVWGARGRGVVEHFAQTAPALNQQVAIRVGTLSKGLGSLGGFVAGSRDLTEWLAHMGRAHMFSTAAPAAVAAAGRAALRIVCDEPQRRVRLLANATQLREQLVARGWNVGNSASQIIPIIVGEPTAAMDLSQRLRERGLWVPGIRPPTVPPGTSRLRVSLTAAHTEEHLERLVAALDEVRGRSVGLP